MPSYYLIKPHYRTNATNIYKIDITTALWVYIRNINNYIISIGSFQHYDLPSIKSFIGI